MNLIVEAPSSSVTAPLLPPGTRLGPVRLAVTERARALAIWRDVVGLELLAETGDLLHLGVEGATLIELEITADRPVLQNCTGLYHVAIHVPERCDLAQFLLRALQRKIRVSPTDHLISEAIYLWDFDGNGIEITFETPWRGTLGNPETGAYATAIDGTPHSGREPINVDDLLGELGHAPALAVRMPSGTRVGHVHVHVNSLEKSMRFYRDGIGFGGLFIIRAFGMGDVGLGYAPHAIAFNIWAGPDAKPAPAGAAGLRWFTINLPDAAALAGLRARLAERGIAAHDTASGMDVRDPSRNLVRILLEP